MKQITPYRLGRKNTLATTLQVETNGAGNKKKLQEQEGCTVCHGLLLLTVPAHAG